MQRYVLPLALALLSFSSLAQRPFNKFGVSFGEAGIELNRSPDNVIRVFLDENGYYYPDFFIADKSLCKSKGALDNWYRKNPEAFAQLCKQYNINPNSGIDVQIAALDDSIAAQKIKLINEKLNTVEGVDLLIHGFRKKAYGNIGRFSSHSTRDNQKWRQRLSHGRGERLFVEIYWDSKFIKGALNVAIGRKPFKLFEQSAIPNAKRVGAGLRTLVAGIQAEKINIFSHSLGAVVAAELLFSSIPSENPTPPQSVVNACFIAPAIGADAFLNYYKRNTTMPYQENDNYRILVIYNHNDFVLEKTYEWGKFRKSFMPTEFGNTSLGCNYDSDVQKLIELFESRFNSVENLYLYDFSFGQEARPMT